MCQLPTHVIAISIATMLKRFFFTSFAISADFCLDFLLGGFLDLNAFNHFVFSSIFGISLDDFSEQQIFNLRCGVR